MLHYLYLKHLSGMSELHIDRKVKSTKGIKIIWTPKMIYMVKKYFPVKYNRVLAAELNVSMRSLIRKARELQLPATYFAKIFFIIDNDRDIRKLFFKNFKCHNFSFSLILEIGLKPSLALIFSRFIN